MFNPDLGTAPPSLYIPELTTTTSLAMSQLTIPSWQPERSNPSGGESICDGQGTFEDQAGMSPMQRANPSLCRLNRYLSATSLPALNAPSSHADINVLFYDLTTEAPIARRWWRGGYEYLELTDGTIIRIS